MKDLIIITGTIVLGCMLFDMIAGDGDSLKTASGEKLSGLLRLYRE